MRNKGIKVSVVIVNYKVEKELIDCIYSILKSEPKISFEIIVVDNNKESSSENELKNKFSNVRYVKSQRNLGYGGGGNLGAFYAQGKYLFFLNPDAKILKGALDSLYSFFTKNKNIGIISPVFLDDNFEPFKSQGSKELTPKTILFSQSLLRKVFPNRNIYNDDLLGVWDMRYPLETSAVPGAAMMISARLFKRIGGFDEKLFLYFEENDISKRVRDLGYRLFIVPSAKIVHLVGRSTKSIRNIEEVYSKSRYFYLKKHYGLIKAIFTQTILSINKTFIGLLFVLGLAIFLRVFKIESTMPFIGDQGWFYLSARDMVVNGEIPLVGIASSHPWLHQGPLWAYMLAGMFWIFGFNPLNGAYLTITLGILSVFLVYIAGKEMFSKRVGLISALLYASSPLIIIHSRAPYHTSPIPLFTLLFIFSLFKWVKGNNTFFPLSILFLAILYNFELATSVLWPILLIILTYGMWKKKEWVKKIFNKKTLTFSFLAFLIPMIPILIYDFNNNFPQTLKFLAWIGYRILKFFGFPSIHGEVDPVNFNSMIMFSFHFYQNLIFTASGIVAFVIFIFSFSLLVTSVYRSCKKKVHNLGILLLALWIVISLLGYFVNKTPSEAYLTIFFPAIIFLTAFSFEKIMRIKTLYFPTILTVISLAAINSYYLISTNYFTGNFDFSKRLNVVREIIKKANGNPYNIVGRGNGSQFESFTMNYQYLVWWLGRPASKEKEKLKIYITEKNDQIFTERKD